MSIMIKLLEETSIHGFKYLIHGKTILLKMIWLVCIVGCVTSSIFIIYLNVKNWQSSPAVVTSVEPILVKDQIPMPQITICPNDMDLNLLFFRLHKKYPELVTEELMAAFQQSARILAFDMFYQKCTKFLLNNQSYKVKIFDQCKSNQGNVTSECQFVHLLTAIVTANGANHLKDYITQQMEKKEGMSLSTLESFIEEATGKAMRDKRFPDNVITNEKFKVLKAYCNFFDVVDPQNPSIEVGLQKLEDYDIDKTMPPIQKEDFTAVYILLAERLAFDNEKKLQTKIIAKALIESLRSFLGLDTIAETVRLLDAYSYDYNERPFFENYLSQPTGGCEGLNVKNPCSDLSKAPICEDYCQFLERTSHLQDKVIELNHMGTYSSSFDSDWSPKGLIPNCGYWLNETFHTGPCFQEIITSDGRCLTTNPDLMSSLKDLNLKDSFVMIMFEGGVLNIHDTIPNKTGASVTYKLYMTAPNHFTIDKFSEHETTTFTMNRGDSVVQDMDLKVDVVQVVETTPEFKAMNSETRNCYYPEEKGLKFFKKYSESSCFLECAWTKAKDQCGCVPWFLLEHFPDSPVCTIHGNNCFRSRIESRYANFGQDCGSICLADCDRYTYHYEQSRVARYSPRTIYPNESCSDFLEDVRNNMTCNFVDDFAMLFGPRVQNLSERILSFNNQYYVRRMRINAKRRTTLRILKTATVTFIDMLSNIGGTLGLFCGFSILSGVEILYWIIIVPYQKLSNTFFNF